MNEDEKFQKEEMSMFCMTLVLISLFSGIFVFLEIENKWWIVLPILSAILFSWKRFKTLEKLKKGE
ncbi:MAG: hypothetical protein CL760_10765 [Chloroflexi bacterium]|nr:hypothetical protein [Chloroflexota bacterium]|tara:strand:- start:28734 stop:28931 length:198 start_codon:yes stop_codon:yes gene_type:complete